jgi:hypothetical protein
MCVKDLSNDKGQDIQSGLIMALAGKLLLKPAAEVPCKHHKIEPAAPMPPMPFARWSCQFLILAKFLQQ